VNASPLIFLTRLGLLDILNEPQVSVEVPDAVLTELSFLDPKDPAADAARSTTWIHVVPTPLTPPSIRPWRLGAGESAVISHALAELGTFPADPNGVEVVLDDAKARRCAQNLGLHVQGTLAFLLIAKTTGRINMVKPFLEQLHSSGMHISTELTRRVLAQAGE
jgi:predicted nucleic acid-binding protein